MGDTDETDRLRRELHAMVAERNTARRHAARAATDHNQAASAMGDTDNRDELRDDDGNFLGYAQRDCGEHRTVGPHRAWCYDCTEWCYPGRDEGECAGCARPDLTARLAAAEAWATAAEERIEAVRALHQPTVEYEQKIFRDGSCYTCEEPDDVRLRPLLRTETYDGERFHVHAVPPQDQMCVEDEQEWPCPTVAALGPSTAPGVEQ